MYPLLVWMLSCLWVQQSSKITVAAYDPLSTSSTGTEIVIVERKSGNNIAEPTCEELRAMWRYSKRQSRAAEKSNELPMYRDPFSYNIWESRPSEYFQPVLGHRESHVDGQPRSRGAGGPPIYGRMVHKAPSGNRLRNGMPDRTKAFEEVTRHYGTINRNPSLSHRRLTSFRVGGGISPPLSQVPQSGRFQHLKELIKTERARELQEQRLGEEAAARIATLKQITNGNENHEINQVTRRHVMDPLQAYSAPGNVNYDFSYYVPNMANFGDTWSRGGQYTQEYMLR